MVSLRKMGILFKKIAKWNQHIRKCAPLMFLCVKQLVCAVVLFQGCLNKNWVTFFLFTFTTSTPLRKVTGVFKSFGRFIGLKCHKYALYSCFAYMYIHV